MSSDYCEIENKFHKTILDANRDEREEKKKVLERNQIRISYVTKWFIK